MKKFAAFFITIICAIAAVFVWDRLPSEKKRRYVDISDSFHRWQAQKAI